MAAGRTIYPWILVGLGFCIFLAPATAFPWPLRPPSQHLDAGPAGLPPGTGNGKTALSDVPQELQDSKNSVEVKSNRGRRTLGKKSWIPRTPELQKLGAIVRKNAAKQRVDEDLVWAVMRQESGFNPRALSPKGAMGLMQLMPGTAAMLGVKDPYNMEQNVAGGVKYLRYCLDYCSQNLNLALAAYNAGPGNVSKHKGVPPFPETINYVAAVIKDYTNQTRPRGYTGKANLAAEPAATRASGLHWRVPLPRWKIALPQDKVGPPRWHGRFKVVKLSGKALVSLEKKDNRTKSQDGGRRISNL